jgi:hypothetical protein
MTCTVRHRRDGSMVFIDASYSQPAKYHHETRSNRAAVIETARAMRAHLNLGDSK